MCQGYINHSHVTRQPIFQRRKLKLIVCLTALDHRTNKWWNQNPNCLLTLFSSFVERNTVNMTHVIHTDGGTSCPGSYSNVLHRTTSFKADTGVSNEAPLASPRGSSTLTQVLLAKMLNTASFSFFRTLATNKCKVTVNECPNSIN